MWDPQCVFMGLGQVQSGGLGRRESAVVGYFNKFVCQIHQSLGLFRGLPPPRGRSLFNDVLLVLLVVHVVGDATCGRSHLCGEFRIGSHLLPLSLLPIAILCLHFCIRRSGRRKERSMRGFRRSWMVPAWLSFGRHSVSGSCSVEILLPPARLACWHKAPRRCCGVFNLLSAFDLIPLDLVSVGVDLDDLQDWVRHLSRGCLLGLAGSSSVGQLGYIGL